MNEHLKVVIRLRTPMKEPDNLFHLDALLAAMRVQEAEALSGAPVEPSEVQHDLPVERYIAPSGEWVFKASAFHLARESEVRMWMQTGRTDLTRFASDRASGFVKMRASKPNLAGGFFKSSAFHYPLVWAELTAYCIGDKARVESLLARCEQIGGRRGVGSGVVESIEVQVVDQDECVWAYRTMPQGAEREMRGILFAQAVRALRPPYWDRASQVAALQPLSF